MGTSVHTILAFGRSWATLIQRQRPGIGFASLSSGGPIEIPGDARHITVPAARLERWLSGYVANHGVPHARLADDTVRLESADAARAWLTVPFPPLADVSPDALLDALVEHVGRARRVGVLLVRRGGYAVGIFAGAELVASKVDSSYVQGTTKAGGWSQKRYSRRGDNQASAAFQEAADTAARLLAPPSVAAGLDALVIGGDRRAIDTVLADPRLAALRPITQEPLLQVPDPRLRVLQATPEQFRAVRIALHP
jgi:Actinobacteria/chloroflexi VLRF1 release factor